MTKEEAKEREDQQLTADEQTVELKISAFAAKLGQETGNKFAVYIYRLLKEDEDGKKKKPFVKKYDGIEPDPAEIAERFRGGRYLVQFIWYVNKKQFSKAYTLDVDEDAFPPLPKAGDRSLMPIGVNSSMSENMQLQMMTINAITEVMKSAYSSGNGRAVVQSDPMETFAGLMSTMEESFSRAMMIQSKVLEKVYERNMSNMYGLTDNMSGSPAASTVAVDGDGSLGKYGSLIKDVVDGLKMVVSMFGSVPDNVVKTVKESDRFKELIGDKQALVVVGNALRREFGDKRAADIMKSFGVQLVFKNPQMIAKTPEIPVSGAQDSPSGSRGASPGSFRLPGGGKPALKSKESGKKRGSTVG